MNIDDRPVIDVEVWHSDIEGSGVFASRSFAAGETIRVVNIVREITADAPLRPDRDEHVEHCNWHLQPQLRSQRMGTIRR